MQTPAIVIHKRNGLKAVAVSKIKWKDRAPALRVFVLDSDKVTNWSMSSVEITDEDPGDYGHQWGAAEFKFMRNKHNGAVAKSFGEAMRNGKPHYRVRVFNPAYSGDGLSRYWVKSSCTEIKEHEYEEDKHNTHSRGGARVKKEGDKSTWRICVDCGQPIDPRPRRDGQGDGGHLRCRICIKQKRQKLSEVDMCEHG